MRGAQAQIAANPLNTNPPVLLNNQLRVQIKHLPDNIGLGLVKNQILDVLVQGTNANSTQFTAQLIANANLHNIQPMDVTVISAFSQAGGVVSLTLEPYAWDALTYWNIGVRGLSIIGMASGLGHFHALHSATGIFSFVNTAAINPIVQATTNQKGAGSPKAGKWEFGISSVDTLLHATGHSELAHFTEGAATIAASMKK